MTWPEYFLNMLPAVAAKSKDPNTKIGAIIVGPDYEIRSTGYNSFPRGLDDNLPARLERPEKYTWIEHAERNAIYNAARMGTPLLGCTLYCSAFPCINCARAIVQAGIKKVLYRPDNISNPSRWLDEWEKAKQMFTECGVEFWSYRL